MELAIIMYHYVRDPVRALFAGLKGISEQDFVAHLDYLSRDRVWIGGRELTAFSRGEASLPERSVLLSFDDGLADHFDIVFPLLKERGIPALFFPITVTQQNGRVADVHKMHLLLGALGTERMIDSFHAYVSEHWPERSAELRITDGERKSPSRYDDVRTGNLKWTVNHLSEADRGAFLATTFATEMGQEADIAKKFYMSWEQMRIMSGHGMTFGSHTHSHHHLTNVTSEIAEAEMRQAKVLIEQEVPNGAVPIISYPFGSVSDVVIDTAKELGYCAGLTVEVGTNSGTIDPMRLKRWNANDALTI